MARSGSSSSRQQQPEQEANKQRAQHSHAQLQREGEEDCHRVRQLHGRGDLAGRQRDGDDDVYGGAVAGVARAGEDDVKEDDARDRAEVQPLEPAALRRLHGLLQRQRQHGAALEGEKGRAHEQVPVVRVERLDRLRRRAAVAGQRQARERQHHHEAVRDERVGHEVGGLEVPQLAQHRQRQLRDGVQHHQSGQRGRFLRDGAAGERLVCV